MNKRLANVMLFVLALGFSGLLGAGALELFVRYRESHRTTVPGTMPFLFYRHARLRHALVRGSDYFGWVHINRQGFRGPDVTLETPPGVTRIMVIGASTVMDGATSSDAATWPARLEHWLDSLGQGRRFEVINAGVPGYLAIDNVIRFQTELRYYRPDLIVLYQAHNDLLGALASGGVVALQAGEARPNEMPSSTPWGHWLEQHSLLYNKVYLKWQAIRSQQRGARRQQAATTGGPAVDAATRYNDALRRGAVAWDQDLSALLALIRTAGLRVVVPEVVFMGGPGARAQDSAAIAGVFRVGVPFAPPDVMLRGYAVYDSVTRAVSAAQGAAYVPTSGFEMGGMDLYAEGDPVHFNDRGADRMGKGMAEALLRLAPWNAPAPGVMAPVPAVSARGRPAPR